MMKKIIFLFTSLSLFFLGRVNGQVFLDEPLTDGNVPANWFSFDEDGVAGDPFFANQGLWETTSEWTGVNFGGAFGIALYSCGEFQTAPTTASDWLVTNAVTLGPSTELSFELLPLGAGVTFEVRIATSISGAVPAPSDFINLVGTINNPTPIQVWGANAFDLSAYANQTVYIALVNTTVDATAGNQVKLVGLRNVQVFQPVNNDARINSITLAAANNLATDYLVSDFNYASYPCGVPSNEVVSIEVENFGLDSIFSFDFGFQIDDFTAVTETVTPANGIAPGATYSHTFMATADSLTTGDPIYGLVAWVDIPGEQDRSNDTTDILVFIGSTHDFNASGPYSDNFDQVDFVVGSIQNFATSWNWTIIDANNDGVGVSITPDVPGGGSAISGDFVLAYNWNTDGTTPANEYAFTPCMDLDTGVAYKISVQAACGEDPNLGIFEESFRFVRNTVPSNTGATIIADHIVGDPLYTEYSSTFVVPSPNTYFLGLQVNSPADRFFLTIDDFLVESFTEAPVAALNVNGQDELVAGVYVLYCDSTITVVNNSTGTIDSTTIDWGDGTVETFAGGSLSHSYTTFGTFSIELTATNILGSSSATATVELTSPPAPTVTVGTPTINDLDVSFTIGNTAGSTNIVFTPECSRIIVDWGDGVIDEIFSAGAAHSYTQAGTYTVTVTIIGTGTATGTVEVTVTEPSTNIQDINFADALSIFPNPSNDIVNVSFGLNAAQDIEIKLYTVSGKMVDARSFTNVKDVNASFNTADLNNGVYLMQITTDKGTSTQKFVVSHQ